MKRPFLSVTVVLSLFLLGYGILWLGNSAAMPMYQVTAVTAETGSPTPTVTPGPVAIETSLPISRLSLHVQVAEKPISDLDGDGEVDPGDTIQVTISFTNTGQITATNVILVDDYDEALVESRANITGAGKDNGDTITWKWATLASGEVTSVSYEATLRGILPPGITTLEDTASISSHKVKAVRDTQSVPVQRRELTITKAREVIDSNGNGVIDGGDIIKYKITYENIGDTPATNVVIVDDYPELYIASISNIYPEGVDDGKTITWAVGIAQTGGKGEITYDARLKDAFATAQDVMNEVTISSDGVELMKAEAVARVNVAPTPTPTSTPTPTATPTSTLAPTPTPTLVPGPAGGIYSGKSLEASILIGVLAFCAMAVLTIVGAFARLPRNLDKEAEAKLYQKRIGMVREGVFLIFIVSAVLILAIGRGIEADGAISILSAIAGYVFGRAVGPG
jgi:uncharacterized repeat protein (TIGR01451 family)